MEGWIKDYRKEIENDIWSMPPLYHRVWQYLKYMVNHEEKSIPLSDGSFFTILPGQHLTSIRNIAKGVGWYEGLKWKEPNPKTIKKIMDWMVQKKMIKVDNGNRQYTLVTLVNWEVYQTISNGGNSKVTEGKQSVGINKNDKNEKNNNIVPAEIQYFNQIIELFNNICVLLPKVQKLTETRKKKLRARCKELPNIDKWEQLFKAVELSPFLCGRNDRGWKASFDWLIENDENYQKVFEGTYSSNEDGRKVTSIYLDRTNYEPE